MSRPIAAGSSLAATAIVLRVRERRPTFFEPPDFHRPTSSAFAPSSHDKDRPSRWGVGVSVFDDSATTLSEAVAIRQAGGVRTLVDPVGLTLQVADIVSLGHEHGIALNVVADPLTPPAAGAALPGASGHALILGLYPALKETRRSPTFKGLLYALACAARVA